MSLWRAVPLLGGVPLMLALPFGVHITAGELLNGETGTRFLVGLAALVGGIVGVECFRGCAVLLLADVTRTARDPAAPGRIERDFVILQVVAIASLQLITLMHAFMRLDGHVYFRACAYLYVTYVAWALPLVTWRWTRATGLGAWYLRWGWAPIIAFGVPFAMPTLEEAGLVPFSPIQW
jgi:hypothetical protein